MQGYFLVVDLLGFSSIIKNLSGSEQDAKVLEWVSLVKALCETHQIEKYQLLSDTLFIGLDENEDSLIRIINFSKSLLEQGFEKYFLIRGGISYGQYEWGSVTFGKAVVAAHDIEQSQKWIGIIANVPNDKILKAYAEKLLVCYPVPIKSKSLQLCSAVNWRVPLYREILDKTTSHHYIKEGQKIPVEVIERTHNTALFGLYLRKMEKFGFSHENFRYTHPFEFVEAIVNSVI